MLFGGSCVGGCCPTSLIDGAGFLELLVTTSRSLVTRGPLSHYKRDTHNIHPFIHAVAPARWLAREAEMQTFHLCCPLGQVSCVCGILLHTPMSLWSVHCHTEHHGTHSSGSRTPSTMRLLDCSLHMLVCMFGYAFTWWLTAPHGPQAGIVR